MTTLTDDQVIALLPALAEAARANEETVDRFVAPRPGIVEETAARRHHFVLGRRGVGKSSLLRRVHKVLTDSGRGVAVFIDLETYRGVPYPDVLIQLLSELLNALSQELVGPPFWHPIRRRRFEVARQRLRILRDDFGRLLTEPQSAEHVVRELQSLAKEWEIGAAAGFGLAGRYGHVQADGKTTASSNKERDESAEARFTRTKMDALFSSAPLVRAVLESTIRELSDKSAFVVLDDFYHVSLDDQPEVLGYLHQLVKNLPIYLKVCGVRHRLNPFVEGDPPTGLQLGQDADTVRLDLVLEHFNTAQTFLEAVLQGVCDPSGVKVSDLLTDGARERLVLGSGAVARDYLNLTNMALKRANQRLDAPARPRNRINAEDVNEASAELSLTKQEDLRRDSGPGAEDLRSRLTSLASFCLDVNGTNVFLVEGTALTEEGWGKEISALADLRLIHEIGNSSIQSGEAAYRGKRFVAFTLDLSSWTGTRSEKIRQIDFWTPDGKQELRRVGLIYRPDDPRLDESGLAVEPRRPGFPKGATLDNVPLPGLEAE